MMTEWGFLYCFDRGFSSLFIREIILVYILRKLIEKNFSAMRTLFYEVVHELVVCYQVGVSLTCGISKVNLDWTLGRKVGKNGHYKFNQKFGIGINLSSLGSKNPGKF